MKKSFMTRVLASGLSLAMAFSMAAATNVTTASAASKPKMIQYDGSSAKNLSVKLGESVKIKVNAATQAKYKVSAVKVSSSKLKATKNAAGTVVKITGAKATEEGKPASVKVSFQVKTTKKASKYAYVSKVSVIDDKLTMAAEATGVKKITVNFNKAVDTTTAKIVVKKVSATPTITSTTFAADAKSAEIVMGTKLTEGTYTVEATVGEDVLTADIAVQDEKLTSFALVSNNLVESATEEKYATISYKALNQYGEMMPADNITVSCSFGKTEKVNDPTADKSGTVKVGEITDALRIPNATGTIVIVDNSTGVNLNEPITYQTKAVAAAATVYGIYNTKTEKLVEGNLKTGDKVAELAILMNIQDQYGSDMTPKNIKDSKCDVSFNAASVLTDLQVDGVKMDDTTDTEMSYDGKSCILVPLKTKGEDTTIQTAGTLSLTIVSANKGVIATPSFTVDDKILIQSLSVSAKDTVYAKEDNELVVDAIDTNGNAVTKYDDLKNIKGTSDQGDVTLKKNSDGTGTFYFKPTIPKAAVKDSKYKNSELTTLVFTANDATSGKYIVKTVNITSYAPKMPWKVSGTTKDTVLATAVGSNIEVKLKTLTYEDQYSNVMDYSKVTAASMSAFLVDPNKMSGTTGGAIAVQGTGDDAKFVVTGGSIKGSATLYLKYQSAGDSDAASEDKYDIKLTVSTVDVAGVVASDLAVKVNNGNAIYGVGTATLKQKTANSTADVTTGAFDVDVVVTGTVGGKTVVIPKDNWTIVDGKTLGGYGKVDATTNPAKTEEKTVTVIVQSDEGPQEISTKVTVSNADPSVKEIKAADSKNLTGDKAVTSGTAVSATALYRTIKVVNQYGTEMEDKKSDVLYTITFTGKNADTYQKEVKKNATQDAEVTLGTGDYTANVKYKLGTVEFSQDIDINVKD